MIPFKQYKQWMIEHYGEPLFRVPVQLASSCPHGRCAFCSENGSKAQQTQRQNSPFEQVEEAIKFSKRRYKAQKLMLYIQAFTADLTDPEQQTLIFQLLEKYNFEAISIGTRPDCLPKAALDFLEMLKTPTEDSGPTDNCRPGARIRREVWVELGVQTANDKTLKAINRGHDWECSRQAILELTKRGIHVAPHVILGLPGETADDWTRTATELAALPLSGLKIHNLHVVKGTKLAENQPAAMNHWEYAEALIDFLRRIPADIPVMRISTDTPNEQLIAPHWHLEKGQFLDYVIQQMECRQVRQGDLAKIGTLENSRFGKPNSPIPELPIVRTEDGSITFFSPHWKEHYHTKAGARLEAEKKFVEPSELDSKLQMSDVKLLDVCFGLGNNALAALCAADGVKHSLTITALEMDKRVVRAAAEHFQRLETDPVDWKDILKNLLQKNESKVGNHQLAIRWGDARWLIQNIEDNAFDVVFHDPFSSQHCPELWSVEFFKQLYRVMKPDGALLTYSSSHPVRGAMREAGFHIAETIPGHQMGNGTIASPSWLPRGFTSIGKLDISRSVPYHDRYLCDTSKTILRRRQETLETIRSMNAD